jgi:hypothetical protein
MGKQLLRIIFLIGSFVVELSIGYAIWAVTAFLNGERIHDKLMTIGDTREINLIERVWIWAGWLPLSLWILGFTWFQLRLLMDLLRPLWHPSTHGKGTELNGA